MILLILEHVKQISLKPTLYYKNQFRIVNEIYKPGRGKKDSQNNKPHNCIVSALSFYKSQVALKLMVIIKNPVDILLI